jgi:hypothetical protein
MLNGPPASWWISASSADRWRRHLLAQLAQEVGVDAHAAALDARQHVASGSSMVR